MLRGARAVVALVMLLAGGFGCNAVLGFDAAELDPTFGVDSGGSTQMLCDQYCTAIMANCMTTNAEYLSPAVCQAMCANIEPGSTSNPVADTVACRLKHAQAAQMNPAVECPKAGPLAIGSDCQMNPCTPFCTLDFALCQTTDAGAPYMSPAQCSTQCAGYMYMPGAGDIALSSGDSFNCRLYHLESAYVGGSQTPFHCPHTGMVSATCF